MLLTTAANKRITVIDMDMDHMRETINRFESMVVLMHDGSEDIAAFQPWLYAIAQAVPKIRIGRINLAGTGAAITHTFKIRSLPAIKIFNRDEVCKPDHLALATLSQCITRTMRPCSAANSYARLWPQVSGKRITDYTGPLEYEPLLSWCEAMSAGVGLEHKLSQPAYEPPTPQTDRLRAAKKGMKGAAVLDKEGRPKQDVPEEVRMMAETMVKEQRLQRLFDERDPEGKHDMFKKYQGRVGHVYREIVEAEGIDKNDQFAVQEANRRARAKVQAEVLTGAPDDVVAEFNREVNLGGKSKDEL